MVALLVLVAALLAPVPGASARRALKPPPGHSHTTTSVTPSTAPTATPTAAPTATPTAAPSAAGPCGTALPPPGGYDHVVWVVMENHSYSEIIGSPSAPYINQIAGQCGSASNFSAETHASLPNYIAMTSGSTQGITDDAGPSSHPLNVASIFSQLPGGRSRSLEESMPSNCYRSDSGQYAVRHDPEAYFTNLGTDCASYDVPLAATPDLSAKFTFVTPNLCNDMHDCGVQTGDSWLQGFLAKVFSSSQYQAGTTAVFLTWDEDDGSAGNHIATLVIAPSVVPGTTSSTAFTHYSMLRTTEELLGLSSFLGNAATATSMRSAFNL